MDEYEPRPALFASCTFDGESASATGILRDVLPFERLLIKANGGDIVMVVVTITMSSDVPGMQWHAIDEATWRSRRTPAELRA